MMSFFNPTQIIYYLVHLIVFIIGVLLTFIDGEYKEFYGAVGASLIAASIAGMIFYIYVKYAEDIRKKLQMIMKHGLHNVFGLRGLKMSSEYKTRLDNAKNNIDILGYGLNTFREEHLDNFETWKAKCKVRVLLAKPNFPNDDINICNLRDKEEGNPDGSIKSEVLRFIDDVKGIIGDGNRGSFSIRYFKCIPSITIFRIDDEILWGPYFVNKLNRDSPMFIVKKGGVLYEQILKQFEEIWHSTDFSEDI